MARAGIATRETQASRDRQASRSSRRTRVRSLLAGANEQNWYCRTMSNFLDRAAMNQVADEPVTVAGHRDEAALFTFGDLANLLGRVAQREERVHRQSLGAQLRRDPLEIGAVGLHLLRLGELEF